VISLLKSAPNIFRITCAIMNSVLLFIFLALLFLAVTFGSISEQAITTEKLSPNRIFGQVSRKQISEHLAVTQTFLWKI